ncbi:MAG: hypothetical protein ACK4HE_11745 [Chitinophagaceae bacterium]
MTKITKVLKLIIFILTISGFVKSASAQLSSPTKCPYLTITGGTILKQGKANLLNAFRGKEYKFLTYDFNQDGRQDYIF